MKRWTPASQAFWRLFVSPRLKPGYHPIYNPEAAKQWAERWANECASRWTTGPDGKLVPR